MSELALNILDLKEIVRLKAVLSEVVLSLPKKQRSCEMQASVAEQLLKFAAEGEKDPIRLADLAIVREAFHLYATHAKALESIRCGFHNEVPRLNRLFSRGHSSHEGLGKLLQLQLDQRSGGSVGQVSNVFRLPYYSRNTDDIF